MADHSSAHPERDTLLVAKKTPSPENTARSTPLPWVTSLPTGTVTFLFSDIEGSTPLWEKDPQAMEEAIADFGF